MNHDIFGAYLEDFNKIKLIIPSNTKFFKLFLVGHKNIVELFIKYDEIIGNEHHLYLEFDFDIVLHLDYFVKVNDDLSYHLDLGKITRTKRFEDDFYYDGPLGITYSVDQTYFRIWTPVAKEVILVLDKKKYSLNYKGKGLWEVVIKFDCDCLPYYYLVRINEEYVKCLDPYAISSTANNEVNYCIDLTKTISLSDYYYKPSKHIAIYEVSIRDISGSIRNDESSYLKFIDHLDYFKNLNIDYLQIMPTFCFGGVNESIHDMNDPNFLYNWGYNPIQYNIPSGWFCTDALNPYTRINEFKKMILAIKKKNLGIVLDVVYNHVYKYEAFSLGILVPGYVYRTKNDGFLMNSSYCGNDLRTEAKMVRRFIIDNLLFLQKEYGIDGFRFDLMGLIDKITIEKAKDLLKEINPNTIIYGEGWLMETTLNLSDNANLNQASELNTVAFFNDYFRNEIGGYLNGSDGFITGKQLDKSVLLDLLCHGSMNKMPFCCVAQSINYIECHDNLTIFDKISKVYPSLTDDKLLRAAKLGLGLVCIAEGISFIHGGEELLRTKKGSDNSYNLNDDVNHFPWENLNTYYDLHIFLKELLLLKKKLPPLTDSRISFLESHYDLRIKDFQIIIKNNFQYENVYFAPLTTLIFNNFSNVCEKCESLNLDGPGIWILKK